MPVLAPFVGMAGLVAGLWVGGTTGALISLAAAGASTAYALATTKKGDNGGSVAAGGHLVNTSSSRQPLPLLYGEIETGINRTFTHIENPYLHMIVELGEGPINGLVREDGSVYSTTGEALPTTNPPLVYLDDQLFSEHGDLVHIELFTGTSTQDVCSTLQSATAKWDQALRYTAYLYVRLEYDRDAFKTMPKIKAKLQGLKIYNPVADATAYTNSPALCAYDYVTRSSQRGGIGVGAARIQAGALSDAIDYCTAKGWTCNMPIIENDAVADNLGLIFANYRGHIIYSEALFKFRFLDLNYESVVMTLTEDDILQAGGVSSLKIAQPTTARPNAVRLVHLSEEKRYKPDDLVVPDADAIAADGDYREAAATAFGLTDPALAGSMAAYHLERLRLNKTAAAIAGDRAKALEPLDVIQLTHTLGWTNKKLRVMSAPLGSGGDTVNLAMIEEATTLYDDVYNLTSHDYDTTDLPDPSAAVPSIINGAYSEEIYYYRGRSFTRLKIDFDPPAAATYPWWAYAEIWLKIGAGAWRYMTRSEGNWQLDPVEEGENYQVKIVSVSDYGQKEVFISAYSISTTITGKTTAPDSLASITAIANGDSVSIYGAAVTDPDVEGYEIRLGAAWSGGIFVSFNKHISLRLNGVRPGTHTFWAAAKGNNGQYSVTPRSANVTVYIPPGFTQLATYGSWAWDFSAGIFSNMEQVTYDSADALKCSHVAELLINGDMEIDGNWTTLYGSFNGQTAVEKHEGTYSWGFGVIEPGSGIKSDNYTTITGQTIYIDFWVYPDDGDMIRFDVRKGDNSGLAYSSTLDDLNQDAWNHITDSYVETAGGDGAYLAFVSPSGISSGAWFYDTASLLRAEGPLTGTWISPTYDLNAIVTTRLWGDFRTAFEASGTTWAGALGTGTAWEDAIDGSKTWQAIFAPITAGQLTAKLLYKELTGDSWTEVEFFGILCAEVKARYVAIEVTMVDPSADAQLYLKELNMLAYTGPQE